MRSASYDNQLTAGRAVVVIEGQIWFIFCSYSASDSDNKLPRLFRLRFHNKWLNYAIYQLHGNEKLLFLLKKIYRI